MAINKIIFSNNHYIVAHSQGDRNDVEIYCSLNNYIHNEQRQLLQRIYPNKILRSRKVLTRQPDYTSCGIFAIANATSIILGQSPRNYALLLNEDDIDHTMELRRHLAKIFRSEKIELFPRDCEHAARGEKRAKRIK